MYRIAIPEPRHQNSVRSLFTTPPPSVLALYANANAGDPRAPRRQDPVRLQVSAWRGGGELYRKEQARRGAGLSFLGIRIIAVLARRGFEGNRPAVRNYPDGGIRGANTGRDFLLVNHCGAEGGGGDGGESARGEEELDEVLLAAAEVEEADGHGG